MEKKKLGIDSVGSHIADSESLLRSRTADSQLTATGKRRREDTAQYTHYLFDIEGTTTPISFVKDVLFPFASQSVEAHLRDTWGDVTTKADVEALYGQAVADASNTSLPADLIARLLASPIASLRDASVAEQVAWLAGYVRHCIALDRKIGPLKQLQGHMWRAGYASGDLRGEVFPDIAGVFRGIVESGARVAIYSSGSREAQKLIFKYSTQGDLSQYISCYFDTAVGGKRDKSSYDQILLSLGAAEEPTRVMFLTDIFEEGVAARAAGLSVGLSVRPGNAALPPEASDYVQLTSFESII